MKLTSPGCRHDISLQALPFASILANRASNGKPFVRPFVCIERPESCSEAYNSGEVTYLLGAGNVRVRHDQGSVFGSSVGLGAPYFRDCWIDQRFPKLAFLAAVALQILLIRFPPPIWNIRPSRVVSAPPQMELTWYGPVKDFPAILPAGPTPISRPARKAAEIPALRGADAFHPRQTIISEPLHPTHPRQTLIQPAAPQEPPSGIL